VKATDSSESVSRRETCLCGEAEAISEDSAKMQAIQMAPFVTEPAIRLDHIQIIHTFVQPPSRGIRNGPPQVGFR
jgi:hypothetical protein